MRAFASLSLAGLLVALAGPVLADCRSEIAALKKVIEERGNDFRLDARVKARKELAKAEVNAVRPAKCRESVQEAKVALKEGRR